MTQPPNREPSLADIMDERADLLAPHDPAAAAIVHEGAQRLREKAAQRGPVDADRMNQRQREVYRPETTRTGGGQDAMADYLYAKGEL